jgi:hypothetical protein
MGINAHAVSPAQENPQIYSQLRLLYGQFEPMLLRAISLDYVYYTPTMLGHLVTQGHTPAFDQ